MGTKAAPILLEEDRKHLKEVLSIEETSNGWEEGPSTQKKGLGNLNSEVIDQILSQRGIITNDLPLRDVHTDDELSTLIGGVRMTTTETMTEATQQIVKAHIRGGEPVEENLRTL